MSEQQAYAGAGVSQRDADRAVSALVEHLERIETGKPTRAVSLPGHYASVLRIDKRLGVAFATDGVGTKMVVAEKLGRFETIGIDCVAMNVNDLVCVGAEPIAMLDFILCREADAEICGAIGEGLRRGAELAGIEIPGGEIAQVGDVVTGWELTGSAIGLVGLDALITGDRIEPGDPVIGLPSSGLHSNGYTLARRALDQVPLEDRRLGRPLGELLLEPTEISAARAGTRHPARAELARWRRPVLRAVAEARTRARVHARRADAARARRTDRRARRRDRARALRTVRRRSHGRPRRPITCWSRTGSRRSGWPT